MIFENIPQTLKDIAHWVVWRSEQTEKGKPTKIPYYAVNRKSMSTESKTWLSFDNAVNLYQSGGFNGLGFVLTGTDIVGIDIDYYVATDSQVGDWIDRFSDTYCEESPSGKLRIFCYGKALRSGKGVIDKKLEIYDKDSPRYLTVTGNYIPDTNTKITNQQTELENVHTEYFQKSEPVKPVNYSKPSFLQSDNDIIAVIERSAQAAKFNAIYHTPTSDNDDCSSLDMALCSILAFYTKDDATIDRIFRNSALMRQKWDRPTSGSTYGKITIAKAIANCSGSYQQGFNKQPEPKKSAQLEYNEFKQQQREDRDNNPIPSFHHILDSDQKYSKFNFLKYIPDNNIFKQYAFDVSRACQLPPHTTFLVGLTAFSSVAQMRYKCAFNNGRHMPLGLYSIAEQPSNASKSRCIDYFMEFFFEHERERAKTNKLRIKELKRIKATEGKNFDDDMAIELFTLENKPKSLFITNTTAEAVEINLNKTNGFFSLISDEQGLINTMLGLTYGNGGVNNNDLLLKGVDGGFFNSSRVGRLGYTGNVVGGMGLFSQRGVIERLISSSGNSGLAGRFIFAAEDDVIGFRDRTYHHVFNENIRQHYRVTCLNLMNNIDAESLDLWDLELLKIPHQGHLMIDNFMQEVEPELKKGVGKYSTEGLSEFAGKLNIQCIKIAGLLHLFSKEHSEKIISVDSISIAINICRDLLRVTFETYNNKDIIGSKAEFTSILSLFQNKPANHAIVERVLIQDKIRTKPFSSCSGNKSAMVRQSLKEMLDAGLLKLIVRDGVKIYMLG